MTAYWGLLGPEALGAGRRRRTLGLAATARSFDELAVPGIGGVWFAKQLVLALLGIAVAERARAQGFRVNNIETANAIEAVACWGALNDTGWVPDARLRGRLKLQDKDDFSFARARKPGFYVTLPMRMRTVQPLLALGLVEGSSQRFNAYRCSELGTTLVEAAFSDYTSWNRGLLNRLLKWIDGEESSIQTKRCKEALSPLVPLSREARDLLRDCLVRQAEGSERRRGVLRWSEELLVRPELTDFSWKRTPACFDALHWQDIHCGALFFNARDAAYAVLDELAVLVANRVSQRIPVADAVQEQAAGPLRDLQARARAFLDENHDPSPGRSARGFCTECCQPDTGQVLVSLVRRDDWILSIKNDCIVPGPGFQPERVGTMAAGEESDDDADGTTAGVAWPEGISGRIANLFLFNADLNGDLERWLGRTAARERSGE